MTASPPTKKRRIPRFVIILAGILIIVCCVIPLIYAMVTGTMRSIGLLPTLTPTPTSTYTPTPMPTATLQPPTPTPPPTDTPIPIPTDTPAPTPPGPPLEVGLYMLELMPKIAALSEALIDIAELLQIPRLADNDWVITVASNIAIIQGTHKELTEMDVPPQMSEIHDALLDATSDCNSSMDYLITGLDNLNEANIETAATLLLSCGEKMQKPTKMIEEYTAQFE